jgi:penicillin G amidase
VLDQQGNYSKAGAEFRLYSAGTRQVLGAVRVDSGSSYDGQSVLPVHFGLGRNYKVDVEVTTMSNHGRVITRVEGVDTTAHIGK